MTDEALQEKLEERQLAESLAETLDLPFSIEFCDIKEKFQIRKEMELLYETSEFKAVNAFLLGFYCGR